MANQSAKKNQKNIKFPVQILTYIVYGATAWFLLWNMYYLLSQQISIFHLLLTFAISYLTLYCFKTIVRFLELQTVQAAEYHIDILAMNIFVEIFDPWTHQVWHIYWLIIVFVLYHLGKWFWNYITPKYEQVENKSEQTGKKQKKQKKQKIKYLKK